MAKPGKFALQTQDEVFNEVDEVKEDKIKWIIWLYS